METYSLIRNLQYIMGCAGSKSTPVVEANTADVNKNVTADNGTLMQKAGNIADDMKENIIKSKYDESGIFILIGVSFVQFPKF